MANLAISLGRGVTESVEMPWRRMVEKSRAPLSVPLVMAVGSLKHRGVSKRVLFANFFLQIIRVMLCVVELQFRFRTKKRSSQLLKGDVI